MSTIPRYSFHTMRVASALRPGGVPPTWSHGLPHRTVQFSRPWGGMTEVTLKLGPRDIRNLSRLYNICAPQVADTARRPLSLFALSGEQIAALNIIRADAESGKLAAAGIMASAHEVLARPAQDDASMLFISAASRAEVELSIVQALLRAAPSTWQEGSVIPKEVIDQLGLHEPALSRLGLGELMFLVARQLNMPVEDLMSTAALADANRWKLQAQADGSYQLIPNDAP